MASRGSRKSHGVADIGSNDAGAGEVESGCDAVNTNHNVSEGPPICEGMYFRLSACVKHDLPTVNYAQTEDVEAQMFDAEAQPSTSESFTVSEFPCHILPVFTIVWCLQWILWCLQYIVGWARRAF